MRSDVDEVVKQWGLRRNAALAESSEEALEDTLRAIANRPRTRAQASSSSSWILRLTPAAAVVVCVVLFALFSRESPGERPSLMVYEVPCAVVSPVEVPSDPLVPVSRYETLFQGN